MARRIEDFSALQPRNEFAAHYLSFTNGGKPAEEVFEVVHSILKDVDDERYRQGLVSAVVAKEVGGSAVLAVVDHSPTRSEIYRLRQQGIHAQETIAS